MSESKTAVGLRHKILETIQEYDESMPLATVIGVLEMLKSEILLEAMDVEEEE